MKHSFETVDTFEVTSRGQTVKVDLTKLEPAVIAAAVLHGVKQKVSDAAASATALSKEDDETRTVEEITVDLMEKAVARLVKDGWSATREAANPIAKWARKVVLSVLQQNPEYAKKLAEYKACATAKEKTAYLDGIWEGNDAVIAEAENQRDLAAKAAKEQAKLAGAITI